MLYVVRIGILLSLVLPALAIDLGLRRRWRRIALQHEQGAVSPIGIRARDLSGRWAPPHTRVLPADARPTDVYDPSTQTIRLSRPTWEGVSTLPLAVAIREASWAACSGPTRVLPLLRLGLRTCWRLGNCLGWILIAAGPILWNWSPAHSGASVLLLTRLILLPIHFGLEGAGKRRCLTRLDAETLDLGEDRQALIHLISALVFTLPLLDLYQGLQPASGPLLDPDLPTPCRSAD
jgi:hypothetical protein